MSRLILKNSEPRVEPKYWVKIINYFPQMGLYFYKLIAEKAMVGKTNSIFMD